MDGTPFEGIEGNMPMEGGETKNVKRATQKTFHAIGGFFADGMAWDTYRTISGEAESTV